MLGWLARVVSRRPVISILVVLVITSLLAVRIPKLEIKTDLEEFLPQSPEVEIYRKITGGSEPDVLQLSFVSENVLDGHLLLLIPDLEKQVFENKTIRGWLQDPEDPRNCTFSLPYILAVSSNLLNYSYQLSDTLNESRETLESVPKGEISDLGKNALTLAESIDDIGAWNSTFLQGLFSNFTALGYNFTFPEELKVIVSSDVPPKYVGMALGIFSPPASLNNTGGNNTVLSRYYGDLSKEDLTSSRAEAYQMEKYLVVFQISSKSLADSAKYSQSTVAQGKEAVGLALSLVQNGSYQQAAEVLRNAISNISETLDPKLIEQYRILNGEILKAMELLESGDLHYFDVLRLRTVLGHLSDIPTDGSAFGELKLAIDDFLYWRVGSWILNESLNATRSLVSARLESWQLAEYVVGYLENDVEILDTYPSLAQTYLKATLDFLSNVESAIEANLDEIHLFYDYTHSDEFLWFIGIQRDLISILASPHLPEKFKDAAKSLQCSIFLKPTIPQGGIPVGLREMVEVLRGSYPESIKEDLLSIFRSLINLSEISVPQLKGVPVPSYPNFYPDPDEEKEILSKVSDIAGLISSIKNGGPRDLQDLAYRVERDALDILPLLQELDNNLEQLQEVLYKYGLLDPYSEVVDLRGNLSEAMNMLSRARGLGENVSNIRTSLSDMYKRATIFLSKDFNGRRARATSMVIYFRSPKDSDEAHELADVERGVIEKAKSFWANVYGYSYSLLNEDLKDLMLDTRKRLLPIAFVLAVLLMLVIIRRLFDLVSALLGISFSIIWAYGIASLLGYNLNQILITVAVILVGLTIDYSIHLTTRFSEELQATGDSREAARRTIRNLGMALFLSMATTAIAFLSNLSSPIPPLRAFGITLAVGIVSAFFIFVLFGASVKNLYYRKRKEKMGYIGGIGRWLWRLSRIGYRRPLAVITAFLVLSGFFAYNMTFLKTSFDLVEFMPEDAPTTVAYNHIVTNYTTYMETKTYLYVVGNPEDPDFLEAMKWLETSIKLNPFVKSVDHGPYTDISSYYEHNSTFRKLVDSLDRNGDGLPDKDLDLVYDWLKEHDEHFPEVFLNLSQGEVVVTITPTSQAWSEKEDFVRSLDPYLDGVRSRGYSCLATGTIVLYVTILQRITTSQIRSTLITLILVVILLFLIFLRINRSFSIGLITSLPVILSSIWILGTIKLLGHTLNVLTVIEASLVIGIGVDYAIHLSTRYVEEVGGGRGPDIAMETAVERTGASILMAALTTIAGFGTLSLSKMPLVSLFGILSSLGVIYSLVSTILLYPAMISVHSLTRGRQDDGHSG